MIIEKNKLKTKKMWPIKVEIASKSEAENCVEFTSLDDVIIAEALAYNFASELTRLKATISAIKSNYSQMQLESKYLIVQFITCQDQNEKARLREQLVSLSLRFKEKSLRKKYFIYE